MKRRTILFSLPLAIITSFALTIEAQTGKKALDSIAKLSLKKEKEYELTDAFRVGLLSEADKMGSVSHVTRNTVISNARVSHVTRNTVISNTRVNHVTRNTVISNTRTNHVTRNTVISNSRVSHVTRNTVIRGFNLSGIVPNLNLPEPRLALK